MVEYRKSSDILRLLVSFHVRCESRTLKSSVFLDPKATFDSVGRTLLWHSLSLKIVAGKFISLFQALYLNSRNLDHVLGDFLSEFPTRHGIY